MYCSGCGQELSPAQGFCSKCGRPAAPPVPPIPGLEFELQNYAGKVKALAVVWFVYAGLSLLWGVAALSFANAFLSGHFGPWMHGPWGHGPWPGGSPPPEWFGPAILHFVWVFLVARTCLAAAAGWGLLKHAQWGRITTIAMAFLSLLKFPFGTALGIWTLIMLLGYRNATLYEQL
jgi:hypothetical protein